MSSKKNEKPSEAAAAQPVPRRFADVIAKLCAPVQADEIQWRIGSRNNEKTRGTALAYVDARAVMRRLDEACGPGGWVDEYEVVPMRMTRSKRGSSERWVEETHVFLCRLSIYNPETDRWVTKMDVAQATDIESAKGGCSDALKRAAVKFGYSRELYELESPWVNLTNKGYEIDPKELPRLRRLIEKGAEPTPVAPTAWKLGKEHKDALVAVTRGAQLRANPELTPEALDGMEPTVRYAPLQWALGQLGIEALAQVASEAEFDTLCEKVRSWPDREKEDGDGPA